MRSGTFALGVLLLVLGGLAFMYAHQGIEEYSTSLGQLGRALSPDAQTQFEELQMIRLGGGITALVGFALTIAGAAGGSKSA